MIGVTSDGTRHPAAPIALAALRYHRILALAQYPPAPQPRMCHSHLMNVYVIEGDERISRMTDEHGR